MVVSVLPTFGDFCAAYKLTPRESRVVGRLLKGVGYKEIALAEKTTVQCIKNLMRFVYLKLEIDGDTNGKKCRMILMAADWGRVEKKRRMVAVMNG
jgi:DNA-binding NarL/FixJ family response regulator